MKCWYSNKKAKLTRSEKKAIDDIMPHNIHECFSLIKTVKERADNKRQEGDINNEASRS